VQMPGRWVGGGDLVVAVLESLQETGIGEQIVVAAGLVVFGAHPSSIRDRTRRSRQRE
jgi:hypothetical protein